MSGAESQNKRTEEEREAASAKRREIMEMEFLEERLALIRLLLLFGVRTSIIPSSLTMSESEEEEEKEEEEVQPFLCEEDERQRAGSPVPSCLSLKSVRSIGEPPDFRDEPGPSDTKDPEINAATDLDSIFSILDMFGFVKNELKRLKRLLTNDPEGLESQEALAAVGHRKPKSKLKNMIGCVFDGFARVMRSGPMFK